MRVVLRSSLISGSAIEPNIVNWVDVGVVEWITVLCELLTRCLTIVIISKEVMRSENWFRDNFFINIVDWNKCLFELRNVWFVKSSFI